MKIEIIREYFESGMLTLDVAIDGEVGDLMFVLDDGTVDCYARQLGFEDSDAAGYLNARRQLNDEYRRFVEKKSNTATRRKVKRRSVVVNKNDWYTRNDSLTELLLIKVSHNAEKILNEYIDKYPKDVMNRHYDSILNNRLGMNPKFKSVRLDQSNSFPEYDGNELVGSIRSFALLISAVYSTRERKNLMRI